jgi:hypothetical protein
MFFPVRDQVSCPYKTAGKIMFLYCEGIDWSKFTEILEGHVVSSCTLKMGAGHSCTNIVKFKLVYTASHYVRK